MWVIAWMAIVILPTEVKPVMLQADTKYESEEACKAEVVRLEPRMPDWMRGHLNANFNLEIVVHGQCVIPDSKKADGA